MTASAGNAGLGIAWAASVLGVRATIVVAETASPAKVAALQALPVELVQHGAGYDEAERTRSRSPPAPPTSPPTTTPA